MEVKSVTKIGYDVNNEKYRNEIQTILNKISKIKKETEKIHEKMLSEITDDVDKIEIFNMEHHLDHCIEFKTNKRRLENTINHLRKAIE